MEKRVPHNSLLLSGLLSQSGKEGRHTERVMFMREEEKVSKTDRHKRDSMHHRHRDRWEERCRETERHIMFETEAKQIKTDRNAKQQIKLIRRDRWMWRNVVIQTETGWIGDKTVQREGESKNKIAAERKLN